MSDLIAKHQMWDAVILYWAFSAAISAMPAPDDKSGKGYLWLYKFLHSLAGNITTAIGSKIPGANGIKVAIVALLIPVMLITSACNASNTISLISTIISAAEIILPAIPGLSAADSQRIIAYVDTASKISQDLVNSGGNNPQAVANAVQDFKNMGVPQLSKDVPPNVVNLVTALSNAVSQFVTEYQNVVPKLTPSAGVAPQTVLNIGPLSTKDQKAAYKLQQRIVAVRGITGSYLR